MDAPLIESGEERTLSVKQHAASTGSSSKKCYFLSLALNVVFFVSTVVLACLYLSKSDHQTHAANSAASFAADKCNFGPTHHSHIVLPLASDKASCAKQDAQFFMSHGATFFCPHTFDVKLLTTIQEDDARKVLCDTHFENIESESSSKVSLRPTLPAGGLPALARGELKKWTSNVMYHILEFGKNNDAGPGHGWNLTTIRTQLTTVKVLRVLYGRELEVQPKPAELTYLAHNAGDNGKAILSHYISTSGTSGFAHILKVLIQQAPNIRLTDVALRQSWATFLTIDAREDSFKERLRKGEKNVKGTLHTYDPATGMPRTVPVVVQVTLDYYAGISDGFAGFGTMCPNKAPYPQSPTVCGMMD
eukprot:g5127.t1